MGKHDTIGVVSGKESNVHGQVLGGMESIGPWSETSVDF
jgi:hypothetical protein